MIERDYKHGFGFPERSPYLFKNDLSVEIIVQFFKNTSSSDLNYVKILQDKKNIYIERFNKNDYYDVNRNVVFAIPGVIDDTFNLRTYTKCSVGTVYRLCNKEGYRYFYIDLKPIS